MNNYKKLTPFLCPAANMALQTSGHSGQVEENASKHSVSISTPPVLCLHSSEGDAGAEGSKHTQGVSIDAIPLVFMKPAAQHV